jgi:hypothetical protein
MSLVHERKNRKTKTVVAVWDNRDHSLSGDDERWYVVCNDHGSLVSVPSRVSAVGFQSVPWEFCEDCREKKGQE